MKTEFLSQWRRPPRPPSPRSGEGGARSATDGVWKLGSSFARLETIFAQARLPPVVFPHPIRPLATFPGVAGEGLVPAGGGAKKCASLRT